MIARHRMTHRALVERASTGDHRAIPSWATFIADQPCWVSEPGGREVVTPEGTKVVTQARLLMPKDTGVKEADRINGITDRQGDPVLAGVLNIRAVMRHHASHDELVLDRVPGGV